MDGKPKSKIDEWREEFERKLKNGEGAIQSCQSRLMVIKAKLDTLEFYKDNSPNPELYEHLILSELEAEKQNLAEQINTFKSEVEIYKYLVDALQRDG